MADPGQAGAPEAIREYGKVIASQAEVLAKIHVTLAGIHLRGGAFGKLPEAHELHKGYVKHANEVRSIADKLPGQISKLADALQLTADLYNALQSHLTTFTSTPGVTGGAGPRHMHAPYKWTTRKSQTILKAVVAPKHKHHGLNGLLDLGIEWVIRHVPMLPATLNFVTGDAEALLAAAAVWHEQAIALNAVIHELRAGADGLPEDWKTGEASATFTEFIDNVLEGMTEIFDLMAQTQQILEAGAKEASTARNLIVAIVRTAVEWIIGNLILDVVVLGGAYIFQATGSGPFLAAKTARSQAAGDHISQVYMALHAVVTAFTGAKATFDTAQGVWAAFASFMGLGTAFGHGLTVGKISTVGSSVVEQALGLEWVTGFLARTLITRLALAGVGPVGLIRKAAMAIGKGVIVPIAKLLFTGKPSGVAQVVRAEMAATGLVALELPEATPETQIETLLEGSKPPPAPAPAPADAKTAPTTSHSSGGDSSTQESGK